MERDFKILVSGHQGTIGSSIMRRLLATSFMNILGFSMNDVDL